MRQIRDYSDDRNRGFCVLCGRGGGTRDHSPSLVFLDEPYPDNLPVLTACASCNHGLSLDEQYVACLIECAVVGNCDADSMRRDKIARILQKHARLQAFLRDARTATGEREFAFRVDDARVRRVVLKLARGHVAFEAGIPHPEKPAAVAYEPMCLLDEQARRRFEELPEQRSWPEVGSRAFYRAATGCDLAGSGWIDVQPGRYRYAVFYESGDRVRIVIGEYLACEVAWGEL